MKSIEGKTCIVTGSGKSIGLAIAKRYAQLGARVAMIDINPGVTARADEMKKEGRCTEGYILDITDRDAVMRCFGEIQNNWGAVYALVNAAGAVSQVPIEKVTTGDWERMMSVNVYGAFYCVQAVIEGMKGQKCGRIINFSSKSGKTGSALMVPYSAAKGAVIAMTQAIAYEIAPFNINCNCLCPGITDATGVWDAVSQGYTHNLNMPHEDVVKRFTEKIPLKRLAAIEDVVDYVEFLTVSGDYCTGQALNITGGREMH
jgi:NAD(P)-dependent dehydrogenase (short-subunit alcohol dehydrogenase family)